MVTENSRDPAMDSYEEDIEALFRSGSAPPTIEGSRAAIGSLLDRCEEEICADPAYFPYYTSNRNLNPRLPRPVIGGDLRRRVMGPPGFPARSFANAVKADNEHSAVISRPIPRPVPRNNSHNAVDTMTLSDSQHSKLHIGVSYPDEMYSGTNSHRLARVQSLGSSVSQSFASDLDAALGRSITPDPQIIRRSPSPCLPPIGSKISATVKKNVSDCSDMTTALGGLNIAKEVDVRNLNQSNVITELETRDVLSSNIGNRDLAGSGNNYIDFIESSCNGYRANNVLPAFNSQFDTEQNNFNKSAHLVRYGCEVPNVDPLYTQYPQDISESKLNFGPSRMDSSGYQKACLEHLFAQKKLHSSMLFLDKAHYLNSRFIGNPSNRSMQYPASPVPSNVFSSYEHLSRVPFMTRGERIASENGFMTQGCASALLEEYKNNKNIRFEFSDIVNNVFVFSVDQFGSRFIQQKLETASVEEKNKIFPEILQHARPLMTDVFGNYVIQKFFEHGTETQRKQLANQLIGHVLSLSLQMYGCRVIQKALEVVDIEQQTQMVSELDGTIMKCVRDQNGNHVIQKCIECVPQERIQFIISSFYGEVVALSTHPYGCRVMQRVLEHCQDDETQSRIVDEILGSVCMLAQDQYGNYVVQHVLQHGKPEVRSAIIVKLVGQIVKMSRQKYASNVVERCLTYGNAEERQALINEMLGPTEENEHLQEMMKDQYGNYVVQKVLAICDDKNRELIHSRIRTHLNVLKRFTYGKHIVARVEKLIVTGERHTGS